MSDTAEFDPYSPLTAPQLTRVCVKSDVHLAVSNQLDPMIEAGYTMNVLYTKAENV